jgi:hypothetical protein
LGHAQLDTTNHYAQANLQTKREALEHVAPRARLLQGGLRPPRAERQHQRELQHGRRRESALKNNNTGNSNIAVGVQAGFNITGSGNIDIGNAGGASDSGAIKIGCYVDCSTYNMGTQTSAFIAGIYGVNAGGIPVYINSSGQLGTVSSSRRYKEDIQDMGDASSGLMRLRPPRIFGITLG